MKTVYEENSLGYPIKVERARGGRYRVTYGFDVRDHLDHRSAARWLGHVIFHALECEGKMDIAPDGKE